MHFLVGDLQEVVSSGSVAAYGRRCGDNVMDVGASQAQKDGPKKKLQQEDQ
jgi:hypothetical protein